MRKYLLVGRTGMGKSSFINTTFGKYIAETAEYEACTKIVEYYAYNSPLGNISLIDTPGLAEDDSLTDERYLSMVHSKVNLNEIYSLLYITRLDDTRFRPDEKRTLKLLTEKLGSNIWNNAILVLTFAASVPSDKRDETANVRIGQIEEFLKATINDNLSINRYNSPLSSILNNKKLFRSTSLGLSSLDLPSIYSRPSLLSRQTKVFEKFKGYWLVDNVVSNWTNEGVSALSLLIS
jgi:GTPase Era involved in 16S rRNA processing